MILATTFAVQEVLSLLSMAHLGGGVVRCQSGCGRRSSRENFQEQLSSKLQVKYYSSIFKIFNEKNSASDEAPVVGRLCFHDQLCWRGEGDELV